MGLPGRLVICSMMHFVCAQLVVSEMYWPTWTGWRQIGQLLDRRARMVLVASFGGVMWLPLRGVRLARW